MKRLTVFVLLALSFQCLANGFDFNKEIQKQLEKIHDENAGKYADVNNLERPHPNLIIFVSLSMPESSLESILRQADEINAAVVIKGVVPQGLKATIDNVSKLLIGNRTDPKDIFGGISIMPERFDQFGVNKVPTYILIPQDKCKVAKDYCDPKNYDKLVGNITPISALNVFRNNGEYAKLADDILRGK
ncbi:type-F conjugative transfer system pilin assembly protein TrbC [Vibrio furnissii]|uniref:type-F conjugative transfer system pilin assembly protein TrbC n=1 Tax=Vibrio furnissii TaxID=29494 RepID=UPI001C9D4174|nr:type-F conjugative transfer system pilin assembly protein TrbC [Vibrio furnissii]MBY7933075.1 type-F conjugative transfer system pilin assembly protein TrbC [Vibrio fluvialis]MCG6230267.1 type-F conjugative transfer system pilin assembly protein TrbC [Vibrio furnissii]MCG6268466.1 type-F conjugative transfer system pilin assembly protein TrbC [Vibrio furnissii]